MTKSSDSQVTTPPTTYRITAMELATRDIKRGTDDLTAWVTEVIHLPRCDTRAAAFEAIGDALLSMNPTSAPADPDVAAWAALSVGTRKAMLSTATGEALAQRLTWACRSVVPHAGTVVSQDATWRTFQERIDVTFREMDGLVLTPAEK
jgi:hypothetical protein